MNDATAVGEGDQRGIPRTALAPLLDMTNPRGGCFPLPEVHGQHSPEIEECGHADDRAGACDAATASVIAGKIGFT
jgi:hypothetical protein